MWDTTNGCIYFNNSNMHQIKPLLNKMQSSTINYSAGTKTYSGNIGNMRIKVDEHKLRFSGSLSTLYFENKVQSLDLVSTGLAIQKFSDLTNLPMHEAQIQRLDFAQNLSMSKPAVSYYPLFGEAKYLERLEQGTGLYYRNKRRELVFYDKSKDLLRSKDVINSAFAKQKLLRFEVRLKGHRNICSYFNIPDLRMERLYDLSFYKSAVTAWATEYDKIEKYNDMPLFNDEVYRNPSQFIAQIMYKGILAMGGRERVVFMLKSAKKRGVFNTKAQYHALQRRLRSLNGINDQTIKNELIIEVNSKVRDFLLFTI